MGASEEPSSSERDDWEDGVYESDEEIGDDYQSDEEDDGDEYRDADEDED